MRMTINELENSYEFKLVKKALTREFPFVKDVQVRDEEDINRWKYSMYVVLVIDPFILGQMYNIPVWYIIVNSLKRGEPYWSTTLTLFFAGNDRIDLVLNIHSEMESVMTSVHKSPAIPQELKLDKELLIGSYIVYPDTLPPLYNHKEISYKY